MHPLDTTFISRAWSAKVLDVKETETIREGKGKLEIGHSAQTGTPMAMMTLVCCKIIYFKSMTRAHGYRGYNHPALDQHPPND